MDMTEPKYIIIGLFVLVVLFGGIVYLASDQTRQNANAPLADVGSKVAQPNMPKEAKQMKAIIKTAKGDIVFELYPDAAPKTVENFVAKAKAGYFNGLKFHRVEDWVIQGGDPLSRDESKEQLWGTGGGNIATELNDKPFIIGAVGVARGQDIKISNDSQFFIVKNDSQFLNGQYTFFGQTVSGMDVVQKIERGDRIISVNIE